MQSPYALTKPENQDARRHIDKAKHAGWRDVLPVDPACDLFPPMGEAGLRELAEDIKTNGLQVPVILWAKTPKDFEDRKLYLLDGRNRLDAMEMAGIEIVKRDKLDLSECIRCLKDIFVGDDPDPYAVVVSANIHRRHLTPEQKRDLIAKVLKAKPEESNRQIASQVKADDKTVAKIRTELEATAEIPQLKEDQGQGRQIASRPARNKPQRRSPAR